jgi:hypothetical protein
LVDVTQEQWMEILVAFLQSDGQSEADAIYTIAELFLDGKKLIFF